MDMNLPKIVLSLKIPDLYPFLSIFMKMGDFLFKCIRTIHNLILTVAVSENSWAKQV